MATLAELKSKVSDDIDDEQGTNGARIAYEVQAAIEHFEVERFDFNVTRAITFDTVDGQEWYGEADNEKIPYLLKIDDVYSYNNGQASFITRVDPDELEVLSDTTGSTGEPYFYAYTENQIRLYPIPAATVYPIRVSALYRLPTITDDQSNDWTNRAFELIRHRAVFKLWATVLDDQVKASKAKALEMEALNNLRIKRSLKSGTGLIRPTAF